MKTVYAKYNKSDKLYTINLIGGEDNDGQELYALYPKYQWFGIKSINI